tara:strand:- start:10680 stop:11210 length:531 start_codon:yes stop_codon:yes gene_type:complete
MANKLFAWKKESYIEELVSRGLRLGEKVSIQSPFFFDPAHCFLISIGDRCTFAPDVRLIAHDASMKRALDFTLVGQIRIGNDCFIGASAIVLANVEIGDNCIIGAGSVVTRSIPANSVAAGNPAVVICSTNDYLEKHQRASAEKGVFGRDYQMQNISEQRLSELLEATKSLPAYLK